MAETLWCIARLTGDGAPENPFRSHVFDRSSVDGDRLENAIRETMPWTLVGGQVADPSDLEADPDTIILADLADLDRVLSTASRQRLQKIADDHAVGNIEKPRELVRALGQRLSPTFDERLHLGSGVAPPTGSFVVDTFTGPSVAITEHEPEAGGPWTGEGAPVITESGDELAPSGASTYNRASGEPASADYDVLATCYMRPARNSMAFGGRANEPTDRGYFAFWAVLLPGWELVKWDESGVTTLGTFVEEGVENGDIREVLVSLRDEAKKVYIGEVERISSSDNALTEPGLVSLRQQGGHGGNGTKLQSLTATDAGGGGEEAAQLSGSATGEGSASGDLAGIAPLAGSAQGEGSASGEATTIAPLQGSASGEGTASGDLGTIAPLSGAAIGEGTASGELRSIALLSGEASGGGEAEGTLAAITPLSGAATGSGEATAGELRIIAPLEGTATGEGTGSAELTLIAPLAGQAVGEGVAAGAFSLEITPDLIVRFNRDQQVSVNVDRAQAATLQGDPRKQQATVRLDP